MERAVFVADLDRLPPQGERCDRLYLGSEFCDRRLPCERELRAALGRAAELGMSFTLVTPFLDEPGLARALALVHALPADPEVEVVANDFGLIEALRSEGWGGTLVAGRLLARQRRGPGVQSFGGVPPGAAAALRGSALESPAFVDLLVAGYGVRRFELDDLAQGVTVPALPAGVGLSLYRPWLLVTATRNCPWVFDGRTWDRRRCAQECRGRLLRLGPLSESQGEAQSPCLPLSQRGNEDEPSIGRAGAQSPCLPLSQRGKGDGPSAGEANSGHFPLSRRGKGDEPSAGHIPLWQRGKEGDSTRPLVLGGCAQFLEHRSDAPPPPGVDRIVWQPGVPA